MNSATPLDAFRGWVSEDFPHDVSALVELCLADGKTEPLMYTHPEFILAAVELNLSEDNITNLTAGYVYLCSYYFCLDSIVDGHARGIGDAPSGDSVALYLSHLLTGFMARWFAIVNDLRPTGFTWFRNEIHYTISENARAVVGELRFRADRFTPNTEEEKDSIIGRFNPLLLLCKFCYFLKGEKPNPKIIDVLGEFIFYLQLADDITDWREDYEGDRMTSFLRECFEQSGTHDSFNELEEYVATSGIFERRVVVIIHGLDSAINTLKNTHGTELLVTYVQRQRDSCVEGLEEFVQAKIAGNVDYALRDHHPGRGTER